MVGVVPTPDSQPAFVEDASVEDADATAPRKGPNKFKTAVKTVQFLDKLGTWKSALSGYSATVEEMPLMSRVAWEFDAFKAPVNDPRSASKLSAFTTWFWYAGVVVYAIVEFARYLNRPEVTAMSLMPAAKLPPLQLTVDTHCSEKWACISGSQPVPSVPQLSPCAVKPEHGINRTFACVPTQPNVLLPGVPIPEMPSAGGGLGSPAGPLEDASALGGEPAETGHGRRHLLHGHFWTWDEPLTVSQRYRGAAAACAAERVVAVQPADAALAALRLTNVTAPAPVDQLAAYAADTEAAVHDLFGLLDADASGYLDGAELAVGSPFFYAFIAAGNIHGDVYGVEETPPEQFLQDVLKRAGDDPEMYKRALAGFGSSCPQCAGLAEYRAALLAAMAAFGAQFAEALKHDFHIWLVHLFGDPWDPSGLGVDASPRDERVSEAELHDAFRYLLRHGVITPQRLAQTVMDQVDPVGTSRAALQLCATDVAAGDDQLGGILLQASFIEAGCAYGEKDCNTRLVINLGDGKEGGMRLSLDLEPSQRKAVQIGVTVRRREGRQDEYELRAADLFYVGKNDDRRASLQVGLQQYAEVLTTEQPDDLLEVYGAIGGFGGLLYASLALLLGGIEIMQSVYDYSKHRNPPNTHLGNNDDVEGFNALAEEEAGGP